MTKTILYLRTDLVYQDFSSGGSVGHTLGVIKGFIDNGLEVVVVTTCMKKVLQNLTLKRLVILDFDRLQKLVKWHLGSFLSSFFVFFKAARFEKSTITALYQRYSILNFSGIVLSWWYKKKLILEYNGSEVWIAQQWGKSLASTLFMPLINLVEKIVLKKADYIIVVSKVLQEELISRGIKKEKILVNPNGVDVVMFDPEFTRIKNVACVKQL